MEFCYVGSHFSKGSSTTTHIKIYHNLSMKKWLIISLQLAFLFPSFFRTRFLFLKTLRGARSTNRRPFALLVSQFEILKYCKIVEVFDSIAIFLKINPNSWLLFYSFLNFEIKVISNVTELKIIKNIYTRSRCYLLPGNQKY